MKKFILFTVSLLLAGTLSATIKITSGKAYYFVCDLWESGTMVLGSQHGVAPFIYYDLQSDAQSPDSYWVIQESVQGYTIQNSVTKEYIVYREGRLTNENGEFTAKGLQLDKSVSDDSGRWFFNENANGSVYITCVADQSLCFNVRTDGTGLVGTYNCEPGAANESFHIYDEKGVNISDIGGGNTEEPIVEGNWGTTEDGFYWESTGLTMPVVLTTSTGNPVLYKIQNVRSGQYVYSDATALYESKDSYTQFYFMRNANGTDINIYTSDGYCVNTSFWTFDEGQYPLTVTWGNASYGKNIWNILYYDDFFYPGYAIYKRDNLSDTDASQSKYMYWNDYNLNTYSCIGLYDCDSGSTFVFYSSDLRHKNYLESQGIDFDGTGGKGSEGLTEWTEDIRLNDKSLIYDVEEGAYYYPLSTSLRGGADFTATLTAEYKKTDAAYSLGIDDVSPDSENQITLSAVTCERDYSLKVMQNGEEVGAAPLRFTFLPVVEMNVPSCNGEYYTTGSIRVTDPDLPGYDSLFVAAYKYRGATAQGFSKKSYAIKLKDADGNSVDREFFGLRNDNNWILDAMAIDKACMRNRVSTDLWNDFATKPLQRREKWETKAKHGTRGRFVELFLNGRYHGLYCMTEKMDRKQLRLKKFVPASEDGLTADTIHGSLYKSSNWTYEVFMGHETDANYFPMLPPSSYDNNLVQETWCGYEVKYPDFEEEKIDWGPLWNAINFVACSNDINFRSKLSTYFERDNIDDYYLFIELMLATDNHGKNMFFYNYDCLGKTHSKLIGMAPWDLDGTWGRRWDGSNYLTAADQDFTNFLWAYEHGTHALFHRLDNISGIGWNKDLKERYATLRATYFNPDNLKKRFTDYAQLFADSHADVREQGRWSSLHNNIQGDVEYICQWIDDRVAYLDEQYGYVPPVDGVETVNDSNVHFHVMGGKGCISIHAASPVTLSVYALGGNQIRTITTQQGQTVVSGFQPGVYIVGGQKVLVK